MEITLNPEKLATAKNMFFDRLADGRFHPKVAKIFPFAHSVAAYKYLESDAEVEGRDFSSLIHLWTDTAGWPFDWPDISKYRTIKTEIKKLQAKDSLWSIDLFRCESLAYERSGYWWLFTSSLGVSSDLAFTAELSIGRHCARFEAGRVSNVFQ